MGAVPVLLRDAITSTNVTHYAYDQFTDTPAYENIAVK